MHVDFEFPAGNIAAADINIAGSKSCFISYFIIIFRIGLTINCLIKIYISTSPIIFLVNYFINFPRKYCDGTNNMNKSLRYADLRQRKTMIL